MNMNKDRVKGMLWGLIVGDAFSQSLEIGVGRLCNRLHKTHAVIETGE